MRVSGQAWERTLPCLFQRCFLSCEILDPAKTVSVTRRTVFERGLVCLLFCSMKGGASGGWWAAHADCSPLGMSVSEGRQGVCFLSKSFFYRWPVLRFIAWCKRQTLLFFFSIWDIMYPSVPPSIHPFYYVSYCPKSRKALLNIRSMMCLNQFRHCLKGCSVTKGQHFRVSLFFIGG